MITNLFSLFDPSLRIFSLSWTTCFFLILFLPRLFWTWGSFFSFFNIFLITLKKEIDYVLRKTVKGNYSFIGIIFITVALYNFLALFPFIYSATSHLLVTLPLSYVFWLRIIVFSWVRSFKHFLSHLIPVGTPVALMSFIVLVEILSNLIRPLALTFRLTANIMAGHLLISLIGGTLIRLPFRFIFIGSFIQSLLVFIEIGVSIIQAYVFSTLLVLYLSEGEH